MKQPLYFSLQIFDPEKSARESFRLVNRVEPSFVIQGLNFHLKNCSSDQKSNTETTNPNFFFRENDFAYSRARNKRNHLFIIF